MTASPASRRRDCPLCPRLRDFIAEWRRTRTGMVQRAGADLPAAAKARDAVRLLIVGLAPGLRGANRTGRPFTGDYAGDLLYATLLRFGLATRHASKRGPTTASNSSIRRITNAVRCVPPENKPTAPEIATCRTLPARRRIEPASPTCSAVLALGRHRASVDGSRAGRACRRAIRSATAQGATRRRHAVLQLPLLALQHQYRRPDRRDVRQRVRGDRGVFGRTAISESAKPQGNPGSCSLMRLTRCLSPAP